MMEGLHEICRTCLKTSAELKPLFSDVSLPRKIGAISSVIAYQGDSLPAWICPQCIDNINFTFDFRRTLINSDSLLKRQAIEDTLRRYKEQCKEASNLPPSCISDNFSTDLMPKENFLVVKEEDFIDAAVKLEVATPDINSSLPYEDTFVEVENCESKRDVDIVSIYKERPSPRYAKWDTMVLCHYCGKQLRKSNLPQHVLIHMEASVDCNICGKMLKNKTSLRGHMAMHKPPSRTCEYCGQSFKFRSNYMEHVNTHTENKKYKCKHCEKYFLKSSTLKSHLRTHTGERPYICEYCKKGFSKRYALKTHIRQHTKEKPFICDYCSQSFAQKVSLNTHIKSKHPEKVTL